MQKRMTDLRTTGVSRMKSLREGVAGWGTGRSLFLEWPFRVFSGTLVGSKHWLWVEGEGDELTWVGFQ